MTIAPLSPAPAAAAEEVGELLAADLGIPGLAASVGLPGPLPGSLGATYLGPR